MPASSWCSTTPSARPASSCPTCWPSSGPRCSWSTPTPAPPGTSHVDRQRRAAPGGRSGPRVGGAPRGGDRPRRRAHGPGRRRGPCPEPTTRRCWCCSSSGRRRPPRAQGGAAGGRQPWRPSEICRAGGAEIIWTKLSASHLMEVAGTGGVTFAASQSGGYIFPALPARLRRRGHTGQPAGHARRSRAERMSEARGRRCPPSTSPTRPCTTPWEQKGMVMRTPGGAAKGSAEWSWSTGSRSSRTTAGSWWCPTPRSR